MAALKSQDVDYVPFIVDWNEGQKLHEALPWKNQRERLEYHGKMGWDTYIGIGLPVTPSADVRVTQKIETDETGREVLFQTWKTPARELKERLHKTEDWDFCELTGKYLDLGSDFRPPRYIESPFKDEKDLDTLEYIFPVENPYDDELIRKIFMEKKELSGEFGYPLIASVDAGMDWLIWLHRVEDCILRVIDKPGYIERLLGHINKAKHKRLELLLNLGVDAIVRRGWYESTDFWNPDVFRRFAKPAIEREIEMVHAAGIPYAYLMDTGVKPLLPILAELDFDCLIGADPVMGDVGVGELRKALPGKSIWGGLSGPKHYGADSPDKAAQAVKDSFAVFGKKGFILGNAVSFRYFYPYENFLSAEREWKRLRYGNSLFKQ